MNTSKKYITYSDLTEETLKSKQRLDLIDFEKSQKESLRLFKEAQTRTLQNSQSLKEAKKFCQMHYQESINRPTLEDSGWTSLNDRIFSVDTSKHVYTIEKINTFTFQIYVSNKTLPIKCASTLKAAKEWCEIHWQSS